VVLEDRLGDRSGHPEVLRHRALGPGGCKPRGNCPTELCERGTGGTPQGSAVSPLLANLFMHYAFDTWLARGFPSVQFERYADDGVPRTLKEALV
jgi:Reverse transcriptase (RNA-dependent DNA polymerase)